MSTSTVNIAFQNDLLREIDQLAGKESRSRSEFLREAARAYIWPEKVTDLPERLPYGGDGSGSPI